jgi:hypothetical protein
MEDFTNLDLLLPWTFIFDSKHEVTLNIESN